MKKKKKKKINKIIAVGADDGDSDRQRRQFNFSPQSQGEEIINNYPSITFGCDEDPTEAGTKTLSWQNSVQI